MKNYNILHLYVHLKMANNHIECLKGSNSNYIENKLLEYQKVSNKLTSQLDRFFKDNGDLDKVEELILQIHEEIDNLI